jgi:hypothetical protein
MNRIYQGKVTNVETKDGNGEWKKLDLWQDALWQHHQLFQAESEETPRRRSVANAVNYYSLALAALA